MKIGIIGSGYIGKALSQHLKFNHHTLSITTRQREKIESLSSIADEVCYLPNSSLKEFCQALDVVIICVAPHLGSDYVSTYLKTAQEIKECLSCCVQLKHIIYTSSTSVYGDHQGNWVTEESQLLSLHANTRCLIETEELFLECRSNMTKVCIFRLAEIVGPGREIEKRLMFNPLKVFPGNGQNYTNLIHRDDIIHAIDFSLKFNLDGIFNLCNDFHLTRAILYEKMCLKFNLPFPQWDPSQMSQHAGNRKVSNHKIKSYGYQLIHPTIESF